MLWDEPFFMVVWKFLFGSWILCVLLCNGKKWLRDCLWYVRAAGGHGVDGSRQFTMQRRCGCHQNRPWLITIICWMLPRSTRWGRAADGNGWGVVNLVSMVEFLRRNYVDRSNIYGTFAVVTDWSKQKVSSAPFLNDPGIVALLSLLSLASQSLIFDYNAPASLCLLLLLLLLDVALVVVHPQFPLFVCTGWLLHLILYCCLPLLLLWPLEALSPLDKLLLWPPIHHLLVRVCIASSNAAASWHANASCLPWLVVASPIVTQPHSLLMCYHILMRHCLPFARLVVAWLLIAPQPPDAPLPFDTPSGCCVTSHCTALTFAPSSCSITSHCTAYATQRARCHLLMHCCLTLHRHHDLTFASW